MSELIVHGNCQHCGVHAQLWVQRKFCSLGCENCQGSAYNPQFGSCSNNCKRRHIRDLVRVKP